jgi:hypothetical protein
MPRRHSGHPAGGRRAHERICTLRCTAQQHHPLTMDIERVNAIGTLLADLSARTAALRGYL